MTTSDVSEILQRLARIEEKLDGSSSHESRIARLERSHAGLFAITSFLAIELQIAGIVLAFLKL